LILGKLTSDTSNTNLNFLAGPLSLGAGIRAAAQVGTSFLYIGPVSYGFHILSIKEKGP